jgi:hypothetical protein
MEPIAPPIQACAGASLMATNILLGVRVPIITVSNIKPPTIKLTSAAITGAFKKVPNLALILACTGNKQPTVRANNIRKYLIADLNLATNLANSNDSGR